MEHIDITPDYYQVTYHDTSRDGECFDEDFFFDLKTLQSHLNYLDTNGRDRTKVWAIFRNGKNTFSLELCELDKKIITYEKKQSEGLTKIKRRYIFVLDRIEDNISDFEYLEIIYTRVKAHELVQFNGKAYRRINPNSKRKNKKTYHFCLMSNDIYSEPLLYYNKWRERVNISCDYKIVLNTSTTSNVTNYAKYRISSPYIMHKNKHAKIVSSIDSDKVEIGEEIRKDKIYKIYELKDHNGLSIFRAVLQ